MKIAVLYGGSSSERPVSIKTGTAVIKALRSLQYDVSEFDIEENQIFSILPKLKKIDMVFIAFHGSLGEDGRIQAILETAKIPFTGSDSLSSRLAMEKRLSKILFETNNIPTPDCVYAYKNYDISCISKEVKRLGLPLAIKPSKEGSTFGFTKLDDISKLKQAIDFALDFDDEVLIETFIEGLELTVSFLAGKALPPILIQPKDGLYDYEHKYTKGATEYLCPAPLADEIKEQVQLLGEKAFWALGCRNYGRADFRLDNNNKIFCLEVNTLPGMTSLSLVPMAAKAMGIDFPELLQRIILDAKQYF